MKGIDFLGNGMDFINIVIFLVLQQQIGATAAFRRFYQGVALCIGDALFIKTERIDQPVVKKRMLREVLVGCLNHIGTGDF